MVKTSNLESNLPHRFPIAVSTLETISAVRLEPTTFCLCHSSLNKMRNYSRRANHLTSHTCTCGHAMSASAAGVSSACFQQEEWSGVGFGPVVFRVRSANLSPYLRSFPRQRIFQGSGKNNRKCIRLPICFFPAREKAKGSDFQFAFSQPGKKQSEV